MNLLLDTQAFLWFVDGGEKLTKKSLTAISNPDNIVFVSAVTSWEITIKHGTRKLNFPPSIFEAEMKAHHFTHLDITYRHTIGVQNLQQLHKDPFDRLLIAQAQLENLTLVTSDQKILAYDVRCLMV